MEVIKKYKTISILTFLIILTAVFGIFYKQTNLFENKEISKTTANLIPTPTPDPFLYVDKLNLPSSYMGYTFTKLASGSATLGKGGVLYSDKSFDLTGTEWIVKKDNVSEEEFQKFKKDFKTFAEIQLFKLDWKTKAEVNGKELTPAVKNTFLSNTWGYIKVSEGKYQALLLKSQKNKTNCPCNIEFRVFLSNIDELDNL
ncbi:MAG: hypothetical protein AAB702_01540 [Patescibacteria group bacterium]